MKRGTCIIEGLVAAFILGLVIAFLIIVIQGLFLMVRDSVRWVFSDHWEMVSWDEHGAKWKNTLSGRVVTNSPYHWPAEHKRTPIL